MARRWLLPLLAVLSLAGGAAAEGSAPAPAPASAVKAKPGAESFAFQAEVSRLMDILINSLYSNKDIFLRELISNSADACDKIRFLSLTDQTLLGEGEQANLEIRIALDKEKKVLTIRDRGIGMTKDQLKDNLGTIAKSGTSAFLESMQKGGDMNLIGQFGVGFYSVYLVADYVEVVSKNNDDPKQWVWESAADGAFSISEDTDGEPLGRGTLIRIHLKEDSLEYADEAKLKALVTKYSEFMNFPIYLQTSKTVDKAPAADEEEEEEDEADAAEAEAAGAAGEGGDGDDAAPAKAAKKPAAAAETETVSSWELLNDNKAIWLRAPADVSEAEYASFYKALTKDFEAPMTYTHFKAEGDVEFRAILFVPSRAEPGMFDNFYSNKAAAMKLYIRRVFISDEFNELLPKYLSFMKGIVDSDTLPLNVSRESLQQHASLKTIKKKLVRKALDLLRKLADDSAAAADAGAEADAEEGAEPAAKKPAAVSKYDTFWNNFGKAIKLGLIEDAANRVRLSKLLRVVSSKSEGALTSLDAYVKRMPEWQKQIYYVTGDSAAELAKSPFLERLLAKGVEVIYLTDPLDEYVMQQLTEYDDLKFQNAAKEDLKFGDADADSKAAVKASKARFKNFAAWWKGLLPEDEIEAVRVSTRLATTPCVVVSSKYGWSANMERIMKAQALGDDSKAQYMKGRKILEINPEHELIKQLDAAFLADKESPAAVQVARVLYDTALLESGYALGDAKSFSQRVAALALASLPQLAYPEDSEPDPEPRKAWVRPDAPPPASDEEAAEQAREVAATLRDMEAAKEGGEGGEEEKAAPAAEVGARDEL